MHPSEDIAEGVVAGAADAIVAQAIPEHAGQTGLKEIAAASPPPPAPQNNLGTITKEAHEASSTAQSVMVSARSAALPGQPCVSSMVQHVAPSGILSGEAFSDNIDCGQITRGIVSDVAEGISRGSSGLLANTVVSSYSEATEMATHQIDQAVVAGERTLDSSPGEASCCLRRDGVQDALFHVPSGHRGAASMGESASTHGTECPSEQLCISRMRPREESATSETDTAVGFRPSLLPALRYVDGADMSAVAHETWDAELEEGPCITCARQLEACCTDAVQESSRLVEENEQLRRELDMILAMTSPLGTPSSERSTVPGSRGAKTAATSSLAKR